MFGITGYDLLGSFLFGSIGMLACAWGKMKELWQPWVPGIALMIYPCFITGGFWMWTVGVVLTVLLFFAKDCAPSVRVRGRSPIPCAGSAPAGRPAPVCHR